MGKIDRKDSSKIIPSPDIFREEMTIQRLSEHTASRQEKETGRIRSIWKDGFLSKPRTGHSDPIHTAEWRGGEDRKREKCSSVHLFTYTRFNLSTYCNNVSLKVTINSFASSTTFSSSNYM